MKFFEMNSASCSSKEYTSRQKGSVCECGDLLVCRTSWTDKNPGRRFLSCQKPPKYACGSFEWVYNPIEAQDATLTRGLLKNVKSKDKAMIKLKKKEKTMEIIVGILCTLVLVLFTILICK